MRRCIVIIAVVFVVLCSCLAATQFCRVILPPRLLFLSCWQQDVTASKAAAGFIAGRPVPHSSVSRHARRSAAALLQAGAAAQVERDS